MFLVAYKGDWEKAKRIINDNPIPREAGAFDLVLPLLLFIAGGRGHWKFFLEVLKTIMDPQTLKTPISEGIPILHVVGAIGKTKGCQGIGG